MRNYSDDQNELLIVHEMLTRLLKEVDWISKENTHKRLAKINRELIDYIAEFDNR